MYFAVPISSKETITDTPLDAKSIRSIYFVNRKYGCVNIAGTSDYVMKTVSISIDGVDVVRDLFVAPFVTCPDQTDMFTIGHRDSRRVSITCLKNVNMSEIKISAASAMDFDVVFEYSSTEVEEELVEYIESKTFTNMDVAGSYALNYNRSNIVRLKYDADRIFAFSGVVLPNGLFASNFSTPSQAKQTAGIGTNKAAWMKLTINYENEVIANKFPLDLLTVTATDTWKDVQYHFSTTLGRNHSLVFEKENNTSDNYILIVYYVHTNKL